MRVLSPFSRPMGDTGLLVLRVVTGLAIASHGAQKLFGWFGGFGLKGTAGFFETIGFAPGVPFALAAGTGELVGGLLIAIGLFGLIGPLMVTGVMLAAIVTVHLGNGFFAAANGFELPLLYAAAAAAFVFTGFGRFALDSRMQARTSLRASGR